MPLFGKKAQKRAKGKSKQADNTASEPPAPVNDTPNKLTATGPEHGASGSGSGPTEPEAAGEPQAEQSPVRGRVLDLNTALPKDKEEERKSLKPLSWFRDSHNRNLAEIKLRKGGMSNGLFLVRDSPACPGDYVLSFVHDGQFHHFQLHRKAFWKYGIEEGDDFAGLDLLIDHYHSISGGLPTTLTHPCKGGILPPPLSISYGYSNLLHKAISDGNDMLTMNILQHPECPDVNSKDKKGFTTLHLACIKGMSEVVSALLKEDAVVSVVDQDGYTPLQRACVVNKPSVISILIQEGHASPQDRHPISGDVALHLAARNGHTRCVKELLRMHAPAWPQNGIQGSSASDPKTPYELAAKFGHNECAKLIDDYKPPEPTVSKKDWFHEGLDRAGAYELMGSKGLQDGLFLVRTSSSRQGSYVITMCYNGQQYNYEINSFQVEKVVTYYIDYGPIMPSLEHLVEHLINYTDDMPCKLRLAISPDGTVKSMVKDGHEEEEYDLYVQYATSRKGSLAVQASQLPKQDSVPDMEPPPLPTLSKQLSNPVEGSKKYRHPSLKHSDSDSGVTVHPRMTEPQMLDARKIKLLYELGQGEYGSVMKGIWQPREGQAVDVAIKTMNEKHMDAGKDAFLNEAKVMVKLNHPCIVKLIGVSAGPPPMLIEELLTSGSLLDFLLDYPEKVEVKKDLHLWAAQVACGMMYLEGQGFVHRDLAARNLLLESMKQVKVGDFGLSRAIQGDHDYYKASHGGRWPVKWYAPESVNFGNFSCASDVWSYGVTLWEMFSFGGQPYGNLTGAQVIEKLEKGQRLQRPKRCPERVYEVMQNCWSYQSADRPTFKELFNHFRQHPDYMNMQTFLNELDSAC